jgi:hypothetical protein
LDDPETYRYWLFIFFSSNSWKYWCDKIKFRILKDSCGGKVFPSRSDFKHCRQMFNTQKEIMRRVGFTDEVNLFRFFCNDQPFIVLFRISIWSLQSFRLFFI